MVSGNAPNCRILFADGCNSQPHVGVPDSRMDDADPDTHTESVQGEAACLARAREWFEYCENSPPQSVLAAFAPTGASVVFPSPRCVEGEVCAPAGPAETNVADETKGGEQLHSGAGAGKAGYASGDNSVGGSESSKKVTTRRYTVIPGRGGAQAGSHYATVRSKHFSWEKLEEEGGTQSEYVSCLLSVNIVGAGERTCTSYHAEMRIGGQVVDTEVSCGWCRTVERTHSELRLECDIKLKVSSVEVLAAMKSYGKRRFDFTIEPHEYYLHLEEKGEGVAGGMAIGGRFTVIDEEEEAAASGAEDPFLSFAAVVHPQEGSVMLQRSFLLVAEFALGAGGSRGRGGGGGGDTGPTVGGGRREENGGAGGRGRGPGGGALKLHLARHVIFGGASRWMGPRSCGSGCGRRRRGRDRWAERWCWCQR